MGKVSVSLIIAYFSVYPYDQSGQGKIWIGLVDVSQISYLEDAPRDLELSQTGK